MTDTTAAAAAPELDLDALEATARAAAEYAPGKWFWRGNTDFEEPSLNCIVPSLGRVEILGHVPVDREADSFEAREHLREFKDLFSLTTTEEDAVAHMEDWLWADKYYEVANTDSRLSVTSQRNTKVPVRDLAVFEVARHRGLPDDTPRTHDGIHRGDIVDVRNPVARHLAAASAETVLALVARIRGLEARLAHATKVARQEMNRADINGRGSATAHRSLEDATDTIHRVGEVTEFLDDILENTFGGGPTEEYYIREEEKLANLSFASGLVKAALNGVSPDEYVDSEQAPKDIRRPARCFVLQGTQPISRPAS
ncbi:hypothetical protein [Arthrobacter sp. UYCo732]|uniref:hypothetical protein n=1 Tax=Arthrobacter sp. UYCo732 TaxID=3156336 RepID=UPI003398B500